MLPSASFSNPPTVSTNTSSVAAEGITTEPSGVRDQIGGGGGGDTSEFNEKKMKNNNNTVINPANVFPPSSPSELPNENNKFVRGIKKKPSVVMNNIPSQLVIPPFGSTNVSPPTSQNSRQERETNKVTLSTSSLATSSQPPSTGIITPVIQVQASQSIVAGVGGEFVGSAPTTLKESAVDIVNDGTVGNVNNNSGGNDSGGGDSGGGGGGAKPSFQIPIIPSFAQLKAKKINPSAPSSNTPPLPPSRQQSFFKAKSKQPVINNSVNKTNLKSTTGSGLLIPPFKKKDKDENVVVVQQIRGVESGSGVNKSIDNNDNVNSNVPQQQQQPQTQPSPLTHPDGIALLQIPARQSVGGREMVVPQRNLFLQIPRFEIISISV
jgi:hypothetical protein